MNRVPCRTPLATLYVLGLVSCGGGYGDGGSSSGPATASLSVNPTTITLGQSATITWNSNGASCTATGAWSGARPSSGTEVVTPTAAGALTYTLRCSGGGYDESEVASTTLTVNAASGFTQTLLVSKFSGSAAATTDPRLLNPGGIAVAPSGPAWVANAATSIAYDGRGNPHAALFVGPTAIVANSTRGFVIAAGPRPGPAELIFARRDGAIAGWSSTAHRTAVATLRADTAGVLYTALTLASNGRGDFLYAADFRSNRIEVFDAGFTQQTASGTKFAFSDPHLPAGYAPFGMLALADTRAGTTQIYVTYARQLPGHDVPAIGAGLGLVNVFDVNGRLLRRLVSPGGTLNAPSGMARAPADFGALGHSFLIANSGDGRINAYDAASGTFLGTVSDSDGRPIAITGLRAIAFGNDSHDQPHNALFFTAGTDEADGIYGRIDPE